MRTVTLFLLAILATTAAAAQNLPVRGEFTVQVVDSLTAQPIWGAQLRLVVSGRSAVTAADGRATLPSAAGDTLVVTRIGFRDWRSLVVAAPGESWMIPLQMDTMLMEALRVTGRSGETVHRVTMCRVEGEEGWTYERFSPLLSVLEALESRMGYRRVPCPGRPTPGQPEPYCTAIRGAVQPVRVFVDGRELTLGLADLADYPVHEVRYVDVEDSRDVVYVVTSDFALERARAWLRHRTPRP